MPSNEKIPVMPQEKKKPRSNRKLLTLLVLFFVIVLVILFFQSSLSKISQITVSGNEAASADDILRASRIKEGDHYFALRKDQVEQRLKALKMIESAVVTKQFPGLVKITVKEFPRVAFQMAADGSKEVLLADGSPVKVDPGVVLDKPVLTGWEPDNPLKVQLCQTLALLTADTLKNISEIRPEPSEAYPDKIKMYTRYPFEVYTTIGYLPDKMKVLDTHLTTLRDAGITSGVLTLLEVDKYASYGNDQQKQGKELPKDKGDKKQPPAAGTVPKN